MRLHRSQCLVKGLLFGTHEYNFTTLIERAEKNFTLSGEVRVSGHPNLLTSRAYRSVSPLLRAQQITNGIGSTPKQAYERGAWQTSSLS